MASQTRPDWINGEQTPAEPDWRDAERRLQHQVEIQSRQIEQVLTRHRVPAGVSGGSVRSHWVSFDLASQLSGGWEKFRRLTGDLTGEIASALGVPEVRLERQNGVLRLAVKRNEPHPVDLLDLLDLAPEATDLSLAVGLDHQGRPVMLNLRQPDLHNILIAGVSGAGKSSLMRSIAISLALTCRQSLAQLAVIALGSAPSGITTRPNPLYPVNYLPHLLFPMAAEVDEAVEALAYLEEEIAYRADNHISSPALVVIVDNADMLLRRVGGTVAGQLASILHAPAEAGVKVIIGATNPGLPDLWQMLQHNVDLRLVGRMADERSARVATGREKSYAQYLDGKGDFIAVSAAGIEPFQAAFIDDYDLHLTLTELHRASSPVLLAQALNDKADLPPSWSAGGAQSFTYDGASERANMEPDDRSGYRTVEIAVEPVEGEWYDDDDGPPGPPWQQAGPDRAVSWLDDQPASGGLPEVMIGGAPGAVHANVPGGLALPLVVDETIHDRPAAAIGQPFEDEPEEAWPADEGDAVEQDAQPDGGPEEEGPVAGARSGSNWPVAEEDRRQSIRVLDEAAEAAEEPEDADESYEMLPFDDGLGAEAPEAAATLVDRPEPGAQRVLPLADDQPDEDEVERESTGDDEEQPSNHGGTYGSGRYKGGESAQKLWPVEPVYTDIDDDLWDAAGADDDDWRKRLH